MALGKLDLNNSYAFVTYSYLNGKIKRVISLIETIDLSHPTSARLQLAAACLEVNALNIDLHGVSAYLKGCYLARLFGNPKFSTLSQKISAAKEKLFSSEWYNHYWRLESSVFGKGFEPTEFEKESSFLTVDSVTKRERQIIDNLKENCDCTMLGLSIESEIDSMDEFFKGKTSILLDYLSFLCGECVRLCKEINESMSSPTLEALAMGLSLSNELYKKNRLPDEIKRFNTEREKALDEYDEDTPERVFEEIYYLQRKKKEIMASRLGGFFNIWNKNTDKKTGEVDFLAVIKEFYPQRGSYREELMNPYQVCYRLDEVYMYDYITNEIKKLRKKEKELPMVNTDSLNPITVNVDNRSITLTGEHATYNEYSDNDE